MADITLGDWALTSNSDVGAFSIVSETGTERLRITDGGPTEIQNAELRHKNGNRTEYHMGDPDDSDSYFTLRAWTHSSAGHGNVDFEVNGNRHLQLRRNG